MLCTCKSFLHAAIRSFEAMSMSVLFCGKTDINLASWYKNGEIASVVTKIDVIIACW